MASTSDVLGHHLQAFGDCDLDEIMADFTDDSVLFTPNGALKGLELRRLSLVTSVVPLHPAQVSNSQRRFVEIAAHQRSPA
jgi:hypothetical protein